MAQTQQAESIDRERAFEIEELFFSATDHRGVITAGNDVFVRVSGYESDELIGRPHNVIRHVGTPKAVFRILWDHLEAARPVMAYVKNQARDGSYYWVAAVARPVGAGYLSVRLKPSTALFAAAVDLYAQMIEVENDLLSQGRGTAMDASTALLDKALSAHGFADYDAFMRAALVAEVMARRDAVRPVSTGRSTRALSAHLDVLVRDLAAYAELGGQLSTTSSVLVDIAEEGTLLALNAVFASRRLGVGGETLSAVSNALQEAFPAIAADARQVVEHIAGALVSLDEASFAVALAVLQHDMVEFFERERADGGSADHTDQSRSLEACLADDVEAMAVSIQDMLANLRRTVRATAELEKGLTVLATIERSGQIEAARVPEAVTLRAQLDQVRTHVTDALHHTDRIATLAHDLDRRTTASNGGSAVSRR